MSGSTSGLGFSLEDHARTLREQVPAFAAAAADRIQAEVPAYAGSLDGRRRRLIEDALSRAAHAYLDALDGLPHRERGAEALFQAMGRGEAMQTGDLTALRASLRVGAALGWHELTRDAGRTPVPDEARGRLSRVLADLVDRLTEQAERGFHTGRRLLQSDLGRARARLAERLLSGRAQASGEPIDPAVWDVPDQVVVVVAEASNQVDVGPLGRLGLVVRHGPLVVAVVDAERTDTMVDALRPACARVALSWPVAVHVVPSAFRWARRALDLVHRGVIADRPVIDCCEHRTQIWLHAETALRQYMVQDLLKPLLAETPNSREILSQTLLTWLETRDSAPAIAAQLGVHPQTVRYRWKRINELFGEDLHDPEFMVQITMLLKASVPLWQAGDHSDVERFRAEEDA